MQPDNLFDLIQESVQWLRQNEVGDIDFGLILGSGLSGVADSFETIRTFDYSQVPNLSGANVESHKGELKFVRQRDLYGLVFAGRIHYYEGHPMWKVAYPVRIIHALGAKALFTTGAAGGLNVNYREGDLVILSDHISLMPESPLRGVHDPRLGDRFPDMSEPYSRDLQIQLLSASNELGVKAHTGVYAGLPGPTLETRAEYKYLHAIGADLVAMSIIPEVLVGVQCGLNIAGICVVSNLCNPVDQIKRTTIQMVVETVNEASPKLARVLTTVLDRV